MVRAFSIDVEKRGSPSRDRIEGDIGSD